MSEKKYTPGAFVWRELGTTDGDVAKRFYGEVAGWKFKDADMGGFTYTLIQAGDREIGGLFKLPPEAPQHAFWQGYVSVDDVDACGGRATAAGGKVLNGPMDVPNVGRMVTMMDPQGAVFSVFKSVHGDHEQRQAPVGEFCWEQLNTSDTTAAKAFYTAVVGWTERPFGAEGNMSVLMCGDVHAGSVMQAPPGVPPHWLSYVHIDALPAARDRVTRNGGKVMMDAIVIPTIGTFGVVSDPQGAVFALFEGEKK